MVDEQYTAHHSGCFKHVVFHVLFHKWSEISVLGTGFFASFVPREWLSWQQSCKCKGCTQSGMVPQRQPSISVFPAVNQDSLWPRDMADNTGKEPSNVTRCLLRQFQDCWATLPSRTCSHLFSSAWMVGSRWSHWWAEACLQVAGRATACHPLMPLFQFKNHVGFRPTRLCGETEPPQDVAALVMGMQPAAWPEIGYLSNGWRKTTN